MKTSGANDILPEGQVVRIRVALITMDKRSHDGIFEGLELSIKMAL